MKNPHPIKKIDFRHIRKNRRNKGFTLVELIVVLVILAILAAIIVPQLLGYIDRAKNERYILQAKNVMTAAQVEFSELYAQGVSLEVTNKSTGTVSGQITGLRSVSGKITPSGFSNAVTTDSSTYNVFLQGTQLAADIWETAGIEEDDQPYACILGLGRSTKYLDSSSSDYAPHKAYTVCWLMYWQDKDDPDSVVYWDGSEWTKQFDWGSGVYRKSGDPIIVNGEKMYFQLYILKFINGHQSAYKVDGNDWATLRNLFSDYGVKK